MKTTTQSQAQMFSRVLQLRAEGLSFRAIEGKMLKAFGMKEVQSGTRAFNLLKRAQAAQKAAKKETKAAVAKTAEVKATAPKAAAVKAKAAVKGKTTKAAKKAVQPAADNFGGGMAAV